MSTLEKSTSNQIWTVARRLSGEHKRLSDLYILYNTPGHGAPGFAESIHRRLYEDYRQRIPTFKSILEMLMLLNCKGID